MRFSTLFLLASAVTLASCGNEDPCYPTGQLGSCCESESDCMELVCLEDFPSGYCSRDCSDNHICPEGGHCLQYQTSSGQGTRTLCLMGCASGQPPCRSGYVCQLVQELGSPVCVPG